VLALELLVLELLALELLVLELLVLELLALELLALELLALELTLTVFPSLATGPARTCAGISPGATDGTIWKIRPVMAKAPEGRSTRAPLSHRSFSSA
jgi:hypothetical protein